MVYHVIAEDWHLLPSNWDPIIDWCKEEEIRPDTFEILPKAMLKYDKLVEEDKDFGQQEIEDAKKELKDLLDELESFQNGKNTDKIYIFKHKEIKKKRLLNKIKMLLYLSK